MLQAVESKPGTGEWPRICAEDVRELLPDLDRVAEEMIDAIQCGVPEYARPLNDTYRASVRHAVTHAVDELAGACSQGYAEATAEVAGEMERRRRRLLDLIVVDPPASHDAIADLAQAARWVLPRQVAALALEPRSTGHLGPLPALPPDVLIDLT